MVWRVNVPGSCPQPVVGGDVDKEPLPPSPGVAIMLGGVVPLTFSAGSVLHLSPGAHTNLLAFFPSLAHFPVLPPTWLVSPPK